MTETVVTQADIEQGLRTLGLAPGSLVMVHSSLSSFGRVDGGADAVIDALLAVLGPGGTLCMPTLTYDRFERPNAPPDFDPKTTPSCVGKIAEVFRRRPGVRRSLHPTHSIAAVGRLAEPMTRGNENAPTPCGPESPWGKLVVFGGEVLMIGCGTGPMTLSHGPEEIFHADVRCTPPLPCTMLTDDGPIQRRLRLHDAYERSGPQREDIAAALDALGRLRRTTVGQSELLLTAARDVWDLCSRWCNEHPGRRRVGT